MDDEYETKSYAELHELYKDNAVEVGGDRGGRGRSSAGAMNKTLGQIGYEAMLARMNERDRLKPTGDPFIDGVWEAQTQQLRDDWEAVGAAVGAAAVTGKRA